MSAVMDRGAAVAAAFERYRNEPGALLCILHAIQDSLGYIPAEVVPDIAAELNLSRAEVHGVISFYHDFRTQPGGRHTVQICRAEACQAVGARELEAHAKTALGVDYHATCSDGSVTLVPVYCLGNCACGPSVRIDNEVYGRVSSARFDSLMAELKAGAE